MATFLPSNALIPQTNTPSLIAKDSAANLTLDYLKTINRKGGPIPSEYLEMNLAMNTLAQLHHSGDISNADLESIRTELGEAMTPKTIQGFAYTQPHGYAGDFEIIEKIYKNHVTPEPHLANWDIFFQAHPAAQAVRNRVSFFLDQVWSVKEQPGRKARILNVASGPGRDLHECLNIMGPSGLHFDCVDQDLHAIQHATHLCQKYTSSITFYHQNIFKFTANKTYDLIWSAGLFDYFSDSLFKRIIKRLLPFLEKSGKLVVGNFSDDNPSQDYMEFFKWLLHHRSSKKLQQLAQECGIPSSNIQVQREPEGVNLFLIISGNG
ncbi:MAG: class I SAM-dependent methyltransferase [Nitrospirota bacterium]|nr:class I SAM-dependent methyltransferase [Nitrospirota bacterium]MDH5585264.1 class I SAM-dependent methyltransferase [Nitrospirota bacterium]MDH5773775.1 class I SAM-dependent methyltransferase [Nitrospirota bacterium]